ncbi:MAG: DUF819 family protein [Proteobacteria bacterium]|nr:DUF819 family protein [Pseudomonadota bacterium]MCH8301398.1 DUF819 family protein [Pseudomonadota bacterium]
MSLPLIGPDQDFAIWAVLIGLAGFGFWCERFPWGRKYSGVMLLITAAIVLANLRIIPTSAAAYDVVWDYLVPIAIPLLLFEADLKRIVRESGPTLIAFIIGSAAVVAGTLIGVVLFDLGPNEAELAGIFTGTYIGGGLNFAAVAEATGMQDDNMLTAAVAADQVITNLHFLLIIFIPGIAWMANKYPTHHMDNAVVFDVESGRNVHRIADLDIAGLMTALALAFALAATGKILADLIGMSDYSILVITVLALMIATVLPQQVEKLSGHREAGNVLMFIFLASVGAGADIWKLIEIGPVLFLFASVIIIVHLVILFGVGKILKLDLAELAMASAVCIGGPASAPALASAKGWRDLLIPGLLLGSLGYAGGSFIGVSVVAWLR